MKRCITQALIKERGHHGCKRWEDLPPPQGLDPGSISVSGGAQGGTVCYIMPHPLSPSSRGPLVEVCTRVKPALAELTFKAHKVPVHFRQHTRNQCTSNSTQGISALPAAHKVPVHFRQHTRNQCTSDSTLGTSALPTARSISLEALSQRYSRGVKEITASHEWSSVTGVA